MNGTANAVVGRDLQGRIDEMRVWHLARPVNRLGTEVQPNWNDRLIVARWGDSDIFGRDTASWAEHLRCLRKWTGVSGMRIRLGIASRSWSSMISNAAARQRFADNIAELIKTYPLDGVDLDFEWMYENTAQWNQYGMLAQAIAPPARTCSSPSPPYGFLQISAAYMQYVDYFTFQNYGPSIDVNTYNSMVTACGNFRKQGFPDNKIILSAPFRERPRLNPAPISGIQGHSRQLSGSGQPGQRHGGLYLFRRTRTLHYNGVTTIRERPNTSVTRNWPDSCTGTWGWTWRTPPVGTTTLTAVPLLRAANRYVSSTSFPDTPSPFSLSAWGPPCRRKAARRDVEVQMEEENLGWMVTVRPEWLSVSRIPASAGRRWF